MDNYTCFHLDRDAGSGKRGGGGLVTYIKDKYNFRYLENSSLSTPDGEYMWFKLELELTRPTYICNTYRSPSGNIENFIDVLEQKVLDFYIEGQCDILILGDINVDLLKRNDPKVKKYSNFLRCMRLSQLVSKPTRTTSYNSSCLDHIISSRPEMYVTAGLIDPGVSDHSLVFTARKKKENRQNREICKL